MIPVPIRVPRGFIFDLFVYMTTVGLDLFVKEPGVDEFLVAVRGVECSTDIAMALPLRRNCRLVFMLRKAGVLRPDSGVENTYYDICSIARGLIKPEALPSFEAQESGSVHRVELQNFIWISAHAAL